MLSILVFLFVIAIILTCLKSRLSIFVFPDGVKVTTLEGFLGWLGWLNLFVALPFVWDGDMDNGTSPLVIGGVALAIALFSVYRHNDKRNVVFNKDAKVYLKADAELKEPGNDNYGFLNDGLHRSREIGPREFFREIFAREKLNKALADGLLKNDTTETENGLRTLPWVLDNAVDIKAQFIFLVDYMLNRYNKKDLFDNFNVFADKVIAISRQLDLTISQVPYPIAKYIAQNDVLKATLDKSDSRFIIETDGYVCEDDENVVAVFTTPIVSSIAKGLGPKLLSIYETVSSLFSNSNAKVIITDKKVVIVVDSKETVVTYEEALSAVGDNHILVVDNQTLLLKEGEFFKFALENLKNK